MYKVLLGLVLIAGCHRADDCERAAKRLADLRGSQRVQAFGACRPDDPIIRCALDNDSDEDILRCTSAVFERSVHTGPDDHDGSGLNPLLAR